MNAPLSTTSSGRFSLTHGQHPGAILAMLCSCQCILAIDMTVVNVANATIERTLGISPADLTWTITAYSLTFGGFLMLGGRIGDLFGRRRLLLVGLCAFGVASIFAGSSQNSFELISARALQGMAAAMVSPSVLGLLAATFPEGRPRQRAYGMWAVAGSTGGMFGFLVGGAITSFLGWRWIFFINVPVILFAVMSLVVLFPHDDRATVTRTLDVRGAVLVTLAIGVLMFGFSETRSAGWGAPVTVLSLLASPVLLAVFILSEKSSSDPILPIALLRRRVAVANLVSILHTSVGIGTGFLAPLFLQQVWGFSPGLAGAGTLPMALGFGIGAKASSHLMQHHSSRRLILLGFSILGCGFVALCFLPTRPAYFTLFMPALVVRSFGQGLALVPLVATANSGMEARNRGVAASMFNTCQQLGGSLGLAVIGTLTAGATLGASALVRVGEIRHAFIASLGVVAVACIITYLYMPTASREPARSEPGQRTH